MAWITRVLKLVAGVFAFAVYVWFAAVRALPLVKARKARRRRYDRPT
ncbi:MAG: hypothetical protein M3168_02665 [Actinomycetota bacterium]|nr:hypothetical protein [Actinomycetota bacterium]